MKRIVLVLGLVSLLAGCRSEPKIDDARRAQHLASFDQIWTTVRDNHYDPQMGGVDWDGARARHRPAVVNAQTDTQAREAMSNLLAELKLSHYGILPAGAEMRHPRGAFVPPLARETPSRKVTFGNFPEIDLRYHAQELPNQVYYFYVSIFIEPGAVMPAFRKAIEDARGCDGFILDLRHNPGGIGGMAMGMGNAFITEPNLKLGSMIQRSGTLNFVLNPQADPYTKPLAILIDGGSASTSEILAGGLQELGRARVFGTPSIGMALPSVLVKLPNGDTFQYVVANYVTTGGKTLEGAGVTPDEVVEYPAPYDPPDPVVEAAVKWIKSQKSSE